ncbi:MAG TPA: hypothetical protein VLT33_48950 [Labilithrix sp.]|nr:hypothetical protein [Labilithrix sp.]
MTRRLRALALCGFSTLATAACGSTSPAPAVPTDGGTAPSDGGAGAEPSSACGPSTLLPRPADRSAKGPWAVGAMRTSVSGFVVEIWYPAAAGSEAGKESVRYDIRADLPAEQAAKISDTDAPLQPCECVRDLPVDAEHGPFPLVVFVHGTAGFKTQNLDNVVHWASRGFVVMAANHPGLTIASFVGGGGQQDLAADVKAEVAAVADASGELSRFRDRVDVRRVGLVGHSAGGNAVAGITDLPGVKVVIPISADAAPTGASVESTLFVSGTADGVVEFSRVSAGYAKAEARSHKRIVGIAGAGHTGVTSLCGIKNAAGKSIVEVARASGVLAGPLGAFADTLFDCAKNTTPQAAVVPIVNAATAAALEETLQCDGSAGAAIDRIKTDFGKVETYEHAP